MNEISLGGKVEWVLSHFAQIGLASILAGHSSEVRFWWQDGDEPRPILAADLKRAEIGSVVKEHAARLSGPDSWLRSQTDLGDPSKSQRSLFAPRAKAPSEGGQWRSFLAERLRALADVEPLDAALVEGLGEPAWWRVSDREARPDDGASRWEMKTRNRGEEMVTHRLLPLAQACAARSAEELIDGLTGEALDDGTGSGVASRSGSGFVPPGEVDSAVAWCALWAMVRLPPTAVRGGVSVTPGLVPWGRTHPTTAALPLYVDPVTPARWGQVMRSSALASLVHPESGEDTVAARAWLKEQGVAGLLRCSVHKGGSQSAPERWVLPGDLDLW